MNTLSHEALQNINQGKFCLRNPDKFEKKYNWMIKLFEEEANIRGAKYAKNNINFYLTNIEQIVKIGKSGVQKIYTRSRLITNKIPNYSDILTKFCNANILFEAIVNYFQKSSKSKFVFIQKLLNNPLDFDFIYYKYYSLLQKRTINAGKYNEYGRTLQSKYMANVRGEYQIHIFEMVLLSENLKMLTLFMEKYYQQHKKLSENYIWIINDYIYTIIYYKSGAIPRSSPKPINYIYIFDMLNIIQKNTLTDVGSVIRFDHAASSIVTEFKMFKYTKDVLKIKKTCEKIHGYYEIDFYRLKYINRSNIFYKIHGFSQEIIDIIMAYTFQKEGVKKFFYDKCTNNKFYEKPYYKSLRPIMDYNSKYIKEYEDYIDFIEEEMYHNCSICLESINPDECFTTKCNHNFHINCMQLWQKTSVCRYISIKTCPMCRQDI